MAKRFDVDKVHAQQQKTNADLQIKMQDKHLQKEIPVDVKASYEASIKRLGKLPDDATEEETTAYESKVAHLEEVLTSGNFRRG